MRKKFNSYFPILFLALELLLINALFFFSSLIARGNFNLTFDDLNTLSGSLVLWSALTILNKSYKVGRAVSFYYTFQKAFATVFIFISVLSIYWLFASTNAVDRHFLMAFVLLLFVWVSIYRVTVHLILDKYRTFGGNIRRAVIVGYDDLGIKLYKLLEKRPQYGIRVKGFFSTSSIDTENADYPILGRLEELFKIDEKTIDFIYISDKVSNHLKSEIIHFADKHLMKVKLLPEIKLDALKSLVLQRYENVSVIDLNVLPLDHFFNRFAKRTFDVLFSSFIIIFILSWLYPLVGLLIKRDSRGPILFRQKRHGKNNEVFYCYKFRTMSINDEADTKWATKDDYRITPFGKFLRKSSLDELPQFFNVFLGQMTIVGPRPHPVKLNEAFEPKVQKYAKRHAFKPGITGLAQAMGYRGEITAYHQMNSRVRLDRFYLQNWSFWLDLKIIIKTLQALYKGQEWAY